MMRRKYALETPGETMGTETPPRPPHRHLTSTHPVETIQCVTRSHHGAEVRTGDPGSVGRGLSGVGGPSDPSTTPSVGLCPGTPPDTPVEAYMIQRSPTHQVGLVEVGIWGEG